MVLGFYLIRLQPHPLGLAAFSHCLQRFGTAAHRSHVTGLVFQKGSIERFGGSRGAVLPQFFRLAEELRRTLSIGLGLGLGGFAAGFNG